MPVHSSCRADIAAVTRLSAAVVPTPAMAVLSLVVVDSPSCCKGCRFSAASCRRRVMAVEFVPTLATLARFSAAVVPTMHGFRVGLSFVVDRLGCRKGCSQVLSSCRPDASNGCSRPTPAMAVARFRQLSCRRLQWLRVGLQLCVDCLGAAGDVARFSVAVVPTPVMAVARFTHASNDCSQVIRLSRRRL
jgi:hypothetical protein